MESLSPVSLFLLFLIALLLTVWFLWVHVRSLLEREREPQSLLLIQQQVDQLRLQLGQTLDNNTQLVQQQLAQVLAQVNERLKENAEVLQRTQQSLGERLDNAARVVGNVQQSLGVLEESNRKLYEVGKNIVSLQELLRAPKLRGGLGEFFLEDLLAQILPSGHFTAQHAFRSGERVDAVIKIGMSLVPVDAKFPLENFKRMLEAGTDEEKARSKKVFVNDVRRHIDAIAAKYILPDEGTYDFALMYIPAENVYYETILKDNADGEKSLSQYALNRHVIPVSPNSFYAYLQVVVLGLKGMKIEERAKDVVQYLSRLQGDFVKFRDDFDILGKHLGHAQASYQNTDRRLGQFSERLLSVDTDERLFDYSRDGKTD